MIITNFHFVLQYSFSAVMPKKLRLPYTRINTVGSVVSIPGFMCHKLLVNEPHFIVFAFLMRSVGSDGSEITNT